MPGSFPRHFEYCEDPEDEVMKDKMAAETDCDVKSWAYLEIWPPIYTELHGDVKYFHQ